MASTAYECACPSSTGAVTNGDHDYPRWLRNVPYEVLSPIFFLCSDHPVELLYPRKILSQVLLSQVCSEWRQVAFNTGALWSNITISDQRIVDDFTHCISFYDYQTCVGRAGAHPLTVSLDAQ